MNHANDAGTQGQQDLTNYLSEYGYVLLEDTSAETLRQAVLQGIQNLRPIPKRREYIEEIYYGDPTSGPGSVENVPLSGSREQPPTDGLVNQFSHPCCGKRIYRAGGGVPRVCCCGGQRGRTQKLRRASG